MIVIARAWMVLLLLLGWLLWQPPAPEALQVVAVLPTMLPEPSSSPSASPGATIVAARLLVAPLLAPSSTATARPPSPTSLPATPSPTINPSPFPDMSVASFSVPDGGFRHNISLALSVNGGALSRVVIPPGQTFSFNKALGPNPVGLPWVPVGRRMPDAPPAAPAPPPDAAAPPAGAIPDTEVSFVAMQMPTPVFGLPGPGVPFIPATAAPANQPHAPEVAPTILPSEPTPEPSITPPPSFVSSPVLGGGICDLASRFVVTGRRLLPNDAFRFYLHTGGVGGVADTDAVSIWATGGGSEDKDLLITNTTNRWLIFEVYLDPQRVTVASWLQDAP